MLIIILLVGCEIKNSNEDYKLDYSSIGNGKIICEKETGSILKNGSYIYLLASPFEGEELIEWSLDGEFFSKEQGILVEINTNHEIVAIFSEIHNNISGGKEMLRIVYEPDVEIDNLTLKSKNI